MTSLPPNDLSSVVDRLEAHERADQGRHGEVLAHAVRLEQTQGALLDTINRGSTAQIEVAALLRARDERDREDRALRAASEAASAGWWRGQWERWGPIAVIVILAVVAPQVLPVVLGAMGVPVQQVVQAPVGP